MKKIILTFIFCLSALCPSFAQSNMEGMRFLTVNALMQYGLKLYDRGDFNEASAVFNHVLTYDDHQSQALHYLKDMGRSPVVTDVNEVPPALDISDTPSLKKAIEAKKQAIKKLQTQIMQMRATMASQSAGDPSN